MTTTVVDHIGLLVTNDPALGDGPLGLVRDAAVVFEGDRIVAVEAAGVAADTVVEAQGRCVIPGFVDSHTHLVFAGDRGDEFAARMAGAPYGAGGILTTVAATRAAPTEVLAELAGARRDAARRDGTTHVEVKSGYGLTLADEGRLLDVAAGLTDDVTLLAAHVVPAELAGDTDAYVAQVCDEIVPALASRARWVDVFCERGAFDADQSRAVLDAGRRAGLGLRVHANQLGPGPGVRLAVEMGAASADHCTYLDDDDLAALAASTTVATFLPATDFSTRQPYPDARRAIDAGVAGGAGQQLQPGVELHHLDAVLPGPGRARPAHDGRRGPGRGHRRGRGRARPLRPGPDHPRGPGRLGGARRPLLHPPRVPPRHGAGGPHDQRRGHRPSLRAMTQPVEVFTSRTAEVGGASVRRALPRRGHRTIGAWCFLDHFGPHEVTAATAMQVGPHPHMGLQTVTWLLEGEARHTDSLGSDQLIRPGQLNLMTAGHGIAHAEDGRHRPHGTSHGVQLWVAQPEATRDGPSGFEHHGELPAVALGPAVATVLVGAFGATRSPARTDTPLVGVDLALAPGAVDVPLEPGFEHGLAVLAGAVSVEGSTVAADQLAYLGAGRREIRLDAAAPARALLLGGAPFGETILMWWNFVARTRDEVDAAVADWESGTARFGEVRTTLERIPAPLPTWA